MKNLLKLLAVGALSLSLFGGVAAAADCNINNGNGSGSTNTCTVSDSYTVTLTCTNGVNATTLDTQTATTGEVTVNGNTMVGTVETGDAENAAALASEFALNCAAAPAVVTPPTTTPPAGGSGGAVAGVKTPAQVKALPNTGPSALATSVAVAATAGAVALATRLGLSGFRRFGQK